MATKNERNTENLVRDTLRDLGYYADTNDVQVEEQKSHIEAVKKRLRAASKTGKGGAGAPEFIITAPSTPDFLVLVECKASPSDHISSAAQSLLNGSPVLETEEEYAKRTQRYAADGALHYASFLAADYHVVAIAASGEKKKDFQVTAYLFPKGGKTPKVLQTEAGLAVNSLLPWEDFIRLGTFDPAVQRVRYRDLMAFSRTLHDFMRDHAKLAENEKPLLVSGTLIALRSAAFRKAYDAYPPEDLQRAWLREIQEEINKADIPQAKKANMTQPYSSIAVHPELGKSTKAYPKGVLRELISQLNEKVWPFISVYHDFDVVGQFYGEFLKYTGGDKKALGIVLTPHHITQLFARLANITKTSKALDICAGTGGFLIAAMQQMLAAATTEAERNHIRQHQLVGVEQQPNMFALAASNMILRGDGKANLYQGSCFDEGIVAAVKAHACTVGLINPPFSQGDQDLHELQFVDLMLDCLQPGGTGVAIVPMGRAIAPHLARQQLLKHHTLDAVMSMPDELFYPVGTVTCIMVFTAHRPHEETNRKTWFGYWKNDGYFKTKHLGRVDLRHQWPERADRWVEMFRNREIHAGESVMQRVTAQDEWCAEAYMETDYSLLQAAQFDEQIRNFLRYKLQTQSIGYTELTSSVNWKAFTLSELFTLKKGKRLTKENMRPGSTPFVGAIDDNNGLTTYVDRAPLHEGNTITVNYNGSVAEAFYQPEPFWCSDDVNVLYPKFLLTRPLAMFIITLIRLEKYRFNYGRKWHLERMAQSEIRLPVVAGGAPDWAWMEAYINALPFSSQL